MSDNTIPREVILDAVETNQPRPHTPIPGSLQHNYDTGNTPTVDQLTTAEAQEQYEFLAFGAPLVRVRRRSDGVVGTLEFTHSPRVYFDFRPSS